MKQDAWHLKCLEILIAILGIDVQDLHHFFHEMQDEDIQMKSLPNELNLILLVGKK